MLVCNYYSQKSVKQPLQKCCNSFVFILILSPDKKITMTSPESMLKLQMQVRQNTAELQDYLKDLDRWEDEVNKTDHALKEMKPKQEKVLPPLRNFSKKEAAKPKIPAMPKQKKTAQQKRLRSYDYKAWDKLDIDKMLDNVDEENEEEIICSPNKIEESVDPLQLAVEHKKKGNENFKLGFYEKAIECYTNGMLSNPENAVLPANRAMAFLKLEKYLETETDCTLALSLDPTLVKAYLRRGIARKALAKVESATRDFKDVLKLEPQNKQARNELECISQVNCGRGKGVLSSTDCSKHPELIKPISKFPHQQSKKPLLRLQVQEVGNDLIVIEKQQEVTETVAKSLPENETYSTSQTSIHITCHDKFNPDYDRRNEMPAIPTAAKTFFQFQADLKKLKLNHAALMEYLKQFNPTLLSDLIKEQINTETLTIILNIFSSNLSRNPEFIFLFLENLSKLKRFEMAVMFFSNADKKVAKEVFNYLSLNLRACDVEPVARKFSIST